MPSFYVFVFKFQNFVSAKVEHQERCDKADDAAHAHIRQEVLGKIDTRIGAYGGKNQQRQQRYFKQNLSPGGVRSVFSTMVISQNDYAAGAKHEEGRGVS
jgi:hypothetical protein